MRWLRCNKRFEARDVRWNVAPDFPLYVQQPLAERDANDGSGEAAASPPLLG